MSQIVIILGAGASRHAGAPLMNDFLDRARDLFAIGTVGSRRVDFGRVFDAISHLQAVHSKSQLDVNNLEAVFGIFEMSRLLNRFPGIAEVDIPALVPSLRRVISETLDKTVVFPIREATAHPTSAYGELADGLNKLRSPTRLPSVITFNYDVALDYALTFHNLNPDYCLSKSTATGGIPLLKLHGSLNWARCPKCGEIVFPSPALVRYPGIAMTKHRFSWAELLPRLEHCGVPMQPEPVIAPPTWNKTEYHEGLAPVWQRAASELSEATDVFVCGYSLPETDQFFRFLFALGSVGTPLIRRFSVFDPSITVEDRFRSLLGPGAQARFSFKSFAFEHAVNAIRQQYGV